MGNLILLKLIKLRHLVLGNKSNIFEQPLGGQVLQPGKINDPGLIEELEPEKMLTKVTTETTFGLLSGLGNR